MMINKYNGDNSKLSVMAATLVVAALVVLQVVQGQTENTWPSDAFCLPAVPGPVSCPSASFQQGSRFWDTEDVGSHNSWTGAVPRGIYKLDNIEQTFCCHPASTQDSSVSWPDGTYCVARYGGTCPSGFAAGSIQQNDEDSNNANSVTNATSLPDGVYGADTLINYCCKHGTQVTPSQEASGFPTTAPFILYQYDSQCQAIAGMRLSNGSVTWDNEGELQWNDNTHYQGELPAGAKNQDTELRYCLYTPGCYATMYTGANYSGRASVTLPAGSYGTDELQAYVLSANQIASIKVPSGCSVTVFSGDLSSGDSQQFTADVPDLGNVNKPSVGTWAHDVESLTISQL